MATLVVGQIVFDMMDVPKKQPPFLLFKKVVNSWDAGESAACPMEIFRDTAGIY